MDSSEVTAQVPEPATPQPEVVLVTTSAVDLTREERAWCLAAGAIEVNRLLALWYRHARKCRRAARKRGEGLLPNATPSRCLC